MRLLFIDLKSLHSDEPFSIYMSAQSFADLLQLRTFDLGWPPFFYVLLHLWRLIFDAEAWIRLLSVVFGVASLFAIYFYSKKFFGGRAALIALLLSGFSWIHINYSQEIRAYTLIMLFSTVSFFSFFLSIKEKKRSQWVLFFVSSLLGALTSYLQFLAFLIQAAYLLVFAKSKRNISLFLLVFFFSAVAVSPWLFQSMSFHLGREISSFTYLKPTIPPILSMLSVLSAFSSGHPTFPLAFFSVPILLFFCFMFLKNMKTEIERFIAFCLLALFAVFFLLAFAAGLFEPRHFFSALWFFVSIFAEPRHFLFVFPLFVMLVARGAQSMENRPLVLFLLFALVSANLVQLLYTTNVLAGNEKNWKALAECVSARIGESDYIVFFTKFNDYGFKYYFKKNNPVLLAKDFNALETILYNDYERNHWVYYSYEMQFFDANNAGRNFIEGRSRAMPCESVFLVPAAG